MQMLKYCSLLCLASAALLFSAGSATADQPPASFSVVLLPDTQNYSELYPETYVAQTRWIKDQAEAQNIKFVIHLGDIVNNPEIEQEWENADRAHRVLDGVVPYSLLPGNHDMTDTRDTTLYDKYFPPQRFQQHHWYGGHLGASNANNYCLFEAAGMKFMVVSLEFSPGDEALQWADAVVASQKDRRVIVATHVYMGTDKRREPGEKIWNTLVRKHPNIFMVVCGHVGGVRHQTSINDAEAEVHEILCDYQSLPNGGNGWLQTLRFVPDESKVYVEAYSPLLEEYNKDSKHTYTFDYDMAPERLKKAG